MDNYTLVCYRRDSGTELSSGAVYRVKQSDGVSETDLLEDFSSVTFTEMLSLVSKVLRAGRLESTLVIQRTDRAGLMPMVIGGSLRDLIARDPGAASKEMSYEVASPLNKSVVLTSKLNEVTTPILRSSFETLAESFGDSIYVRYSEETGSVECPFCGHWRRLAGIHEHCTVGKAPSSITLCSPVWAQVDVQELLATNNDRFYLPRAWNPGKTWISRLKLQTMYDNWKTEKESL